MGESNGKRFVAIVGGGIAGLAAAREIRRRMPDVEPVILEAGRRAGGVLATEHVGGFLCEHAASGFLDNVDDGGLWLAKELGVDMVCAQPEAKRRWIFRGGALRQVPNGPPALLSSELLTWRGKLRLLCEPLVPKGGEAEETVADFIKRRVGEEALHALVEPLVLGIFAGDAEQISLPAAFPRLAALEKEHGSLFRGLVASRGRMPKLWAPRGGLAALVAALVKDVGPVLRTGTRVQVMEKTTDGFRLGLEGGGELRAHAVVLAVPAWEAAELMRDLDATVAVTLRETWYAPAVVVHATAPDDQVEHSIQGFGFMVGSGEPVRCLGCVLESTVWPDRAPPGSVLFRLIYGGARDPGVVALSDEELIRFVEADLRRTLSLRRAPHVLRIVRHNRAIPQYTVGHVGRVALVEDRARAVGVVMAGSCTHGVGVNDCVRDATRVATSLKEVLDHPA
ncbi:MAG: protoporphyrinogen oxidase [Deltaproteobacteria bacterium]|nr:protoporphyrinogen oxidase [Deltaproteobacteria bacterium]